MWEWIKISSCILYNNNGPNGHLFYVGGDLMMRRGMVPIIMLPDGDLRIVLHLVPFWSTSYSGLAVMVQLKIELKCITKYVPVCIVATR